MPLLFGKPCGIGYNRHMEKNTTTTNKNNIEHTPSEQPEKHRRNRTVFGAVLCVCALGASLAGYYMPAPWAAEKRGYIHVEPDMTAAEVAEKLHDTGYIQSSAWFRIAARLTGREGELKAGEYIVDSRMSMQQVLEKLASGKSEAARLVIPEGYTVWQIAQSVAKLGKISEEEFLNAARDSSQLYPYMNGNRSSVTFPVEGFLFPDTYFIPNKATAEDIIAMMLKNFDRHLTDEMKQKISDRNLSIYQFVTLSSLVEKEAKYDDDRPLIASVFFNRLESHMKLQSDASISYAMGSHKAEYSIAETQYDSPYNTYMYEGLPPGAIGNPGMDSMEAVLSAPKTYYFYFVADGGGQNYFSMTYEDHMKNVQEHMP